MMNKIHYVMNTEKRLRIVIFSLTLVYIIILGTAFYYQIIGNQDISIYLHQKNLFELKLIDMVEEDMKKIYEDVVIVTLVFFLFNIVRVVLKTRREMIVHLTVKLFDKFRKAGSIKDKILNQ